MNSARVYRWLAGLAVGSVASIAGVVSFAHIQTLALAHGYTPSTARLLPFSVDGLIVAASLALMAGARPWLSRAALVLGVSATIFANIAQGAQFGPVGAIISAWPAVAFIVASEVFIGMVRKPRPAPVPEPVSAVPAETPSVPDAAPAVPVSVPDVPDAPAPVPAFVPDPFARLNGHRQAAREIFAADIESGRIPTTRRVRAEMHVGQPKAKLVKEYLQTLTPAK